MDRLIKAWHNSRAGLAFMARSEMSFRLELIILGLSIPGAVLIAPSMVMFVALVGSVVAIMIVEILNTAIEQVCNGLSRDYMEEIRVAKDCGSAAVLLASLLAGVLWLAALWSWLTGMPVA